MNAQSVGKQLSPTCPKSIQQLEKAVRTLKSDTSAWKNPCRAEYLKEIGRIYLAHGEEAALVRTLEC